MALRVLSVLFSYQLLTLSTGNVLAGVNATAGSGRCDFQIKNVCARLKVRLFIVDRILNAVASVVKWESSRNFKTLFKFTCSFEGRNSQFQPLYGVYR